MTNLRL